MHQFDSVVADLNDRPVRHEALRGRMELKGLHRQAVVAA